jgi:hypothetical protein
LDELAASKLELAAPGLISLRELIAEPAVRFPGFAHYAALDSDHGLAALACFLHQGRLRKLAQALGRKAVQAKRLGRNRGALPGKTARVGSGPGPKSPACELTNCLIKILVGGLRFDGGKIYDISDTSQMSRK